MSEPKTIHEPGASTLPATFPPLKTLESRPNNLPVQRSALFERETELAAVGALLARANTSLLTLSGRAARVRRGWRSRPRRRWTTVSIANWYGDGEITVEVAAEHDR